jgi:hypothetical protein
VVGAAPAALDTLFEIATSLNNNATAFTVLSNAIAAKQDGSAVLTFVAGAGSADAAGVRTRLGLHAVAASGAYGDLAGRPTLGTAAALNVAASGNAEAAEVVKGDDTRLGDARTPVEHTQPANTISDSTIAGRALLTAANVAAQQQLLGLPSGEVSVTTSRALAPTDENQTLRVSNGQALTLDTGSMTGAGAVVSMAPASGAAYTAVVGTATLRTRVGGTALAGGAVISSATARDGVIMIGREPDGSYLLLAPTQNEVFATITASAAFPNRTNERLARYFVNVASGNVVLTIAAGQFPSDPQMSGVEIVVLGGGTNTCTVAAGASVTLQVQGSASAGSGKSIIVRCDPVAANTPRVAA